MTVTVKFIDIVVPPHPGQTPGWGGVAWVTCSKCRSKTDMFLETAKRQAKPFVCRACYDEQKKQENHD